MKVIVVKSTIKGCHIFRRRPHSAIEMFVHKEFGNPKDFNAMTIDIPVLENTQKPYHNNITRHEKGKKPVQPVDIAGKTTGRVPATFGKTFRKLIDAGLVMKITW